MSFFEHFAGHSPTAIGAWLTRKTVAQQFRFLRPYLPSDPSIAILEIGPGQGEFAALFCQAGFRNYDIVEPDEQLRATCRQLPIRNEYSEIAPPLPMAGETYDLLIMCDVFEHMNDPRMAGEMLGEVRRVLKPKGLFFVLCPDYLHWKEEFFNCDFSHSNPTTVRRMNQMLFNHGFASVATTYHYTFLTGLTGYLTGSFIKLATRPFVRAGSDINSRIYRLRVCFLRRFLLISRRR